MKYSLRKPIITFCLFCLSIFPMLFSVGAYDFETNPLPAEQQQSIWEKVDLHPIEILKRFDAAINSFDVSGNKKIVLALDDCQILVLDSSFQPVAMFEFTTQGSYYVHWDGENIVLRLERSSLLISFTLSGNMVEIKDCDDNSVTNRIVGDEQLYKTSMLVDGAEYYVRKTSDPVSNFFMGYSYHQLVCRQPDGTEILLYDVSNNHSGTFIWAILIIAVIGIVTIFVGGLIVPRIIRKRTRR